ncbi:hypothetical protein WDV76_02190 [Xenorhabdus griffiniae]|uniref:hypothetical protein n=1 Tax=Xenorhabdus griffiniae TaxID=351672 RepID=UPI0030D5198F
MSIIKTFDDWYEKLSLSDQNKILEHILNNKHQAGCEGFHAGPSGVIQEGLFAAPSGVSVKDRCPVCKRLFAES